MDCTFCHMPITTTGTAGDDGPVHIGCFHKEVAEKGRAGDLLGTKPTLEEVSKARVALQLAVSKTCFGDELFAKFISQLRHELRESLGEGIRFDGLGTVCVLTLPNGHRLSIDF